MNKEEIVSEVLGLFDKGYTCSQSVLLVFGKLFGYDERTACLISSVFGGGMGHLREKCGALTGCFMVIGLAYASNNPTDAETKRLSFKKVRDINNIVEQNFTTTNCGELLQKYAVREPMEKRQLHQPICKAVLTKTAETLYDILSEDGKIS